MLYDKIRNILQTIVNFLQQSRGEVDTYWECIPSIVRVVLMILVAVSGANILAAIVKAVIKNLGTWKKCPDTKLMFSFFCGSGQFQRKHIIRDAYGYLYDSTWSVFSFAGMAFRLGNYECMSKVMQFLLSLPYLALSILGLGEMIIRFLAGTIICFVTNLGYMLLLLALYILFSMVMPLFKLWDKAFQIMQHCQKCHTSFKLPVFECPQCRTNHSLLHPGKTGLLWSRCICGHFIPCSFLTNRKKLTSHCTSCDNTLPSSNLRDLSVQMIGTPGSGKTSYIAALQHCIKSNRYPTISSRVSVIPRNIEAYLDSIYNGELRSDSEISSHTVCNVVHFGKRFFDKGLVLYDMNHTDSLLTSNESKTHYRHLSYVHGILITIDPLHIPNIRDLCDDAILKKSLADHSFENIETCVINFINYYSGIIGRSAKCMIKVPVAVVITKADIPQVRDKILLVSGLSEKERADACREFLMNNGFKNLIYNIECVFRNVSFFAVSSTSGCKKAMPYELENVTEPMKWIAKICNFPLNGLIASAEVNPNDKS